MSLQYVFWDLDGTLMDTSEGVIDSYEKSARDMGYEPPSRALLKSCIGPPIEWGVEHVIGVAHEEVKEAISRYTAYYQSEGAMTAEEYEGTSHCLAALRDAGVRQYMATMKPMEEARIIRSYHSLGKYIDGIYAVDLQNPISDKAVMLRQALQELGAASGACIMIGDRDTDIRAGKALGMKTAAVFYGFGAREELEAAHADFYAESPRDLEERLLSLVREP